MSHKKKLFPKLQKKLSGFLTDESGKVTKKGALGLAAGATLLSGIQEVSAGWGHHSGGDHTSGSGSHANVSTSGHRSGYTSAGHASGVVSPVCNHASGIVNGHFSGTPSVSSSGHASGIRNGGHASGYAHASGHGSHSSY